MTDGTRSGAASGTNASPPRQSSDPEVERAARIARLADVALLDPLVGLVVPGLGDIVTAGFGLYVVAVAVRKRLPRVVIARMLLNLGIDAAVGAIPLAGDVFDFAFRANLRNVDLLQQRHATGRGRAADWAILAGAALALAVALALPVLLLVWFIRAL